MMKSRSRVLIAALVCTALSPALAAEEGDLRLQFGLVFSKPTDDRTEPTQTEQLEDSTGFQVSFEYMLTDKIGIEPGLAFANHDVEVTDASVPDFDLGETDSTTVTANLNFHVFEAGKLDVFVGPTVGYVFWGDFETSFLGTPEQFSTDDEFVYGANAGLVVPCGSGKWGFAASLTYLFSEVSLEGSGDLGVDPLQLKLGATVRF